MIRVGHAWHNVSVYKVHKPYDWTYTTAYAGTVPDGWAVSDTDEGIDYESLKQKEPILHHAVVNLFGGKFFFRVFFACARLARK